MEETLKERLRTDLVSAMKERDQTRVSVLRTTLAAIENSEAVDAAGSRPRVGAFSNEASRRQLNDEEMRRILADERDALREAETEMRRLGDSARSDNLCARAALLDRYLSVRDS
jgi:uncharacterized protein YqeY